MLESSLKSALDHVLQHSHIVFSSVQIPPNFVIPAQAGIHVYFGFLGLTTWDEPAKLDQAKQYP